MKKARLKQRRALFVDVDGTLTCGRMVNTPLVDWLRKKKSDGFYIALWSSRGIAHAEAAADKAGITDILDAIIPKPTHIVDDKGWSWVKYTKRISHSANERASC